MLFILLANVNSVAYNVHYY